MIHLTNGPAGVSVRPLRVVLPGGSGQVGQMLAGHFQHLGHQVTVLTRSPFSAPWLTVHWDGQTEGPWIEALEGADVCINLTGRSVNCRYTAKNRADIYWSRIATTRLLNRVIKNLVDPPRVWMNASTATIYRHATDRPMDEKSGELGGYEMIARRRRAPETWDFSVSVAKEWENVFFETSTPRTRKVALRSALTLSPLPGSVFDVLLKLVRYSVGGHQGNGRQFVSWIHEADFARAVDFLIDHEGLDGPVNLASPNPLSNRAFMEALREAYGMPNGLPAPEFAIKMAALFLRTEPELVLKSRWVLPERLTSAGFEFEFPTWPQAAEDLVQKWRDRA